MLFYVSILKKWLLGICTIKKSHTPHMVQVSIEGAHVMMLQGEVLVVTVTYHLNTTIYICLASICPGDNDNVYVPSV